MEILAIVGALVVGYWLVSLILGLTLDRITLGVAQLSKNLKAAGIDPTGIGEPILRKIAKSAELHAIASGPDHGRFKASEFKKDLDMKSLILVRHALGTDLNDDEKFLIGLADDLESA